jgi:MFS family permease
MDVDPTTVQGVHVRRPLDSSFSRLWLATGSSNLGDGIVLLGVALIAVQLSRSPVLISLLTAAATLPWLLLALHAGALADRWDRRRIMVVASWLRTVALGGAALAAALDHLTLPVLYVVAVAFGVAEVFSDVAAQSMLPMVVPRDRLDDANGRLVATQTVANNFLGGPVAGVLVSLTAVAALAVPALLYAVAGLVLLRMRGRFRVAEPSTARVRTDIAEGLRYLARHRVLRALAVQAGTFNLANAAYFAVFVLWAVGPASAIGFTASGYGVLVALMAVGAVVGSVMTDRLSRRVGNTRLLIAAQAINALALLVPVVSPTVSAVSVAVVLMGFTNAMVNVLIVSLRQRLVPERLLGRVNAACRLIGMGSMPLGAVLGGVVGDLAGLPVVFSGAVVICLLGLALTARAVLSAPADVDAVDPVVPGAEPAPTLPAARDDTTRTSQVP